MQLKIKSLCVMMTVLASLLLTGCKHIDATYSYQLTLSENSVVFDMGGASKSIDVLPFPESEPWEAVCEQPQDWFEFEVLPNSLIVTVQPNLSLETRSGSISLISPDSRFEPYLISIHQESAQPVQFSTTAADYAFDSEGGDYTFTVSSNYEWTVDCNASWLTVSMDRSTGHVTISALANESEEAQSAIATISTAEGGLEEIVQVQLTQGTRADNPYFKLIGKWEITSNTWYYSPNGSLNRLDYNPNQNDYYLIFDMEAGEYGKTLIMRDFLYPDTSLEIRYEDGHIVIPFGWSVYSYTTFLYITLVGERQFSYASLEVEGTPSEDYSTIALDIPAVAGFNHVGFGLWTYNDNGDKVAVGSNYRPTMFPMSPIVFRKQINPNQQ